MSKKTATPNILMICSDQHSFRVAGSYGDDLVSTPNIDRLAHEGAVFDAAYCNAPLCVPSRMSFLSGKYPFNCDVLNNGCTLDSRIPTLPHVLAGAGYHTVLAGRMHFLGPDQFHGFTERLVGDVTPYAFYGIGKGLPTAPLPGELGHMDKPDPLMTVGEGSTSLLDYDLEVSRATCEWLKTYGESKTDTPFLMVTGLFNPHCPYIAPPELYRKYASRVSVDPISQDEFAELHPFHQDYLSQSLDIWNIPPENLNKAAAAYYGLVEFVDQCVGNIVQTLEEAGLSEDTIVIYTSDHGEMLGEHGRWHKGCFYEASVRVPLIINIPGKKGSRIAAPVSLVDLLPTLADLSGAETAWPVDGQSLLPLLSGAPASDREYPVLAEYYTSQGANRMVRLGKWKLNYYGEYNSCELFDLETDPDESDDLYPSMEASAIVKELRALLFKDGWHKNIPVDFDERMNKTGYWKNMKNFVGGVSNDPMVGEIPGYWKEIEHCENIVEP